MGRRELLVGAVRDLHDLADGELKAQAVDALVDRLMAGRPVRTVTSRDIFDSMMDDCTKPTYPAVLDLLDGLLGLNQKAGDEHKLACADLEGKAKELITSYVLGRPEWIEEECAEIENEAPELA